MTWVTWRQQRTPLLVGLGVVLLLAIAALALRLEATSAIAELGADCGPGGRGGGCPADAGLALSDRLGGWISLLPLPLLALPVAVGALTGGPLFAREHEQGTDVFTLTQSVSRTRWWATRVVLVGAPLGVAMGGLGLLVTWALRPVDYLTTSRLETPQFQIQGLAPAAYFVIAFSVAATLGLLLRSTVGAIALTVVGHLVLVPALGLVRPHYLPAESVDRVVSTVTPSTSASPPSGADPTRGIALPEGSWVVSTTYRDADGATVDVRYGNCGDAPDLATCLSRQGVVSQRVVFQPPERFWDLQLVESGIATALAGAALAGGLLRLRRRGV